MGYLKRFMQDYAVASIAETGRFAARRILGPLDLEHARLVVEYGPGNGVLSKRMLERMPKDSQLVVVETNAGFCEELRNISDPRLVVCEGSAENIEEILAGKKADIIVSGIPFSFLKERQEEILDATVRCLTRTGSFVVYQTTPRLVPALRERYEEVRRSFEFLNIPALFVMHARNPKN